MRRLLPALPVLLLLLASACGGGGGGATPVAPPAGGLKAGDTPPAFALPDVNAASPTYTLAVTPAQSLSKASAWYFGWAT